MAEARGNDPHALTGANSLATSADNLVDLASVMLSSMPGLWLSGSALRREDTSGLFGRGSYPLDDFAV